MNEKTDSPPPTSSEWSRRDIWLGLLFLVVGGLIIGYGTLVVGNGWPLPFWGMCFVIGPVFAFLGANAILQSLRSRRA